MTLIDIDSINVNTVMSKYNISNNKPQSKTDEIQVIDVSNTNDYVDFSMDYTNEDVSTILGNIKDSFDNNDYMSNNTSVSVADCTDKYGKILKSINSNSKVDDSTKVQLTKALDNSFDRFMEKKVKEFSGNISRFLNKECYRKESYADQADKIGIKGDKVVNEDDVERNVKNMFLSAKNFYKNNLNGTKEELEIFLQDKFSKTESLEKLSYNDFKSLQKAIDIVDNNKEIPTDISISGWFKRQSELMNNAQESLKKDGVSSILTDAFKKVADQSNKSNKRIETYAKIRFTYEQQLEDLFKNSVDNKVKLDELKKKREKMIEEYNKEMKKLQQEMYKLNMLNIFGKHKKNKYDPIESLTKQHNKQLENLDKQQIQIENSLNDIRKNVKEISGNYDKFMKNPAPFIDDYLNNEQEK